MKNMNNINRVLTLILAAVVLTASFAGCNTPVTEESSSQPPENSSSAVVQEELDAIQAENDRLKEELEKLQEDAQSQANAQSSETESETPDAAESDPTQATPAASSSAAPVASSSAPSVPAQSASAAPSVPQSSQSGNAARGSVFDGHNLTVYDWAKPATTASGNGPNTIYSFYSADGTNLGGLPWEQVGNIINDRASENGILAVASETGEDYSNSALIWLNRQFNIHRGLEAGSGSVVNKPVEKFDSYVSAQDFAAILNVERSKSGLSELTYDSDMESLAMLRAEELRQSYSHTRPNGERIAATYNYGEIIYISSHTGSAEHAYDTFYNSEGHRSIMFDSYSKFAVGCYSHNDGRTTYWAVLFSY